VAADVIERASALPLLADAVEKGLVIFGEQ